MLLGDGLNCTCPAVGWRATRAVWSAEVVADTAFAPRFRHRCTGPDWALRSRCGAAYADPTMTPTGPAAMSPSLATSTHLRRWCAALVCFASSGVTGLAVRAGPARKCTSGERRWQHRHFRRPHRHTRAHWCEAPLPCARAGELLALAAHAAGAGPARRWRQHGHPGRGQVLRPDRDGRAGGLHRRVPQRREPFSARAPGDLERGWLLLLRPRLEQRRRRLPARAGRAPAHTAGYRPEARLRQRHVQRRDDGLPPGLRSAGRVPRGGGGGGHRHHAQLHARRHRCRCCTSMRGTTTM